MTAIYKRELKSFFFSFIGWLYVAVMITVMGIYFILSNLLIGYPTISYVLQSVVFLIVFTIPILTMRSLSEERKYKTDQLILTSPVTVSGIVLGKYLALVTVFVIPLAVIGITPLILMMSGDFQIGLSYTSLLGFFLYGCLGLAIGLLVSSLTESVVISAVLTLVIMFAGYIMSGLCSIISSSATTTFAGYIVKILYCFDMVGRFDVLSSGYFEVEAVVYYVTFTAFVLFCTTQSIHKRRYAFAGKGIKLGAYGIFNILVAAVLTVLVNLGLNHVPDRYMSFDVTANRIFTLTDEAIQTVTSLSQDVVIYVLTDENSKDADVDRVLQQLKGYSKYIRVEYVNPVSNPMFYYKYTDIAPSANSLIVAGENRNVVIDYNDLYIYQINYYTYENEVVGIDAEGQLISAIIRVTSEDVPKFYHVIGHNELVFDDMFMNALTKENVISEDLALYAVDEIPPDADVIVINAPISDYSEDDADKVISFLDKGGNALIIPTWTDQDMNNFEKILAYYGVSLVDGVIVETDRRHYYQTPYDIFPYVMYEDITQSIYDGTVFAPLCRGLNYDADSENVRYIPLLTTSEDSFSKTNLINTEDYNKSSEDIDGPFVIAMETERPAQNGEISTAVIVSTEQMFTAGADGIVPGYNVKLFGGIAGSLTENGASVVIPGKYYEIGNLVFNAWAVILTLIIVGSLMTGCLIAGLIIWLVRRRK